MNDLHDDFETVATKEPLAKMQRTVKTPMPSAETEENTITRYVVEGKGNVKVSKISHLGWNVRLYGHDEAHKLNPDERFDTEQEAHEEAKELVKELL